MRRAAAVLALVVTMVLAGCAGRRMPPPVPAPVVQGPSFAELEPGSRVYVLTPMLKSGGFLLRTEEQKEEGNTITLRAGDEFQGYETAVYAVQRAKKDGVRIVLAEVTVHRDGKPAPARKPFAPRMRMPGRMRHVRLLYMQKVSQADHNMAVLAATDRQRLQALTQRVQAAPEAECRGNRNEYCEWIPAGVAVRAERPK